MHSPFPPKCEGKFRAERVLAAGGFGRVYLATQVALERPAAIKLLNADIIEDAEQRRRFLEEARITASIQHPNVVVVLDSDVEDGVPWIAYEFLPGRNLKDVLAGGPLPIDAALECALQVAAALEAVHAQDILHRDIKPANVIEVEAGRRYKVTDFGIARWSRAGAVRTQAGLVFGTPAYISPEQIRGEGATAQSDLYALGVMLFELLTGHAPFADDNVGRLLERHLRAPVPAPSAVDPRVPPTFDAIVLRAMAKVPADRFATASDMRAALERCQPAPGAPVEPRRRTGRSATVTVPRRTGAARALPKPGSVAPPRRSLAWGAGAAALAALFVIASLRAPPRAPPTAASASAPAPSAAAPSAAATAALHLFEALAIFQPAKQLESIHADLAPIPAARRLTDNPAMDALRGRWLARLDAVLRESDLPVRAHDFLLARSDFARERPLSPEQRRELLLEIHDLMDLKAYCHAFNILFPADVSDLLWAGAVDRDPMPGAQAVSLELEPPQSSADGAVPIPGPAPDWLLLRVLVSARFHDGSYAGVDDAITILSPSGKLLLYEHPVALPLPSLERIEALQVFGEAGELGENARFDIELGSDPSAFRTVAVIRDRPRLRPFWHAVDRALFAGDRLHLRVRLRLLPEMSGASEHALLPRVGVAYRLREPRALTDAQRATQADTVAQVARLLTESVAWYDGRRNERKRWREAVGVTSPEQVLDDLRPSDFSAQLPGAEAFSRAEELRARQVPVQLVKPLDDLEHRHGALSGDASRLRARATCFAFLAWQRTADFRSSIDLARDAVTLHLGVDELRARYNRARYGNRDGLTLLTAAVRSVHESLGDLAASPARIPAELGWVLEDFRNVVRRANLVSWPPELLAQVRLASRTLLFPARGANLRGEYELDAVAARIWQAWGPSDRAAQRSLPARRGERDALVDTWFAAARLAFPGADFAPALRVLEAGED